MNSTLTLDSRRQDLLDKWRRLNGLYLCPKDLNGTRLGPLVGYSGTYEQSPGKRAHYVGDGYFNFAMVEESTYHLQIFARTICYHLAIDQRKYGACIGIPNGGLALGLAIALERQCAYLYPEKKVTALASSGQREVSELVFKRHVPRPNMEVVVVEDIINNFSNTDTVLQLLEKHEVKVVALASALNRSQQTTFRNIPIISALHLPTPSFRQDDPAVSNDVVAGNVVWDPKANWDKLLAAMASPGSPP